MGSRSGSEVTIKSQHKQICTRQDDEGDDGTVDLDRISQLPDCIISHILSFMEIKCAMKTSILSSMWRYLWTSVDVLAFSDLPSCFYNNESFPKFVEHVILQSTCKKIREFSLHCWGFRDLAHINTWICYVLATKNVSLVDLYVEARGKDLPILPLPKCILTCNTLVTLNLGSRFDVKIPASMISFPSLKHLSLVGVYPDDGELLRKLLSMCPVLEYFRLVGYFDADRLVKLSITIPSLETLALELMVNEEYGLYEHEVIIDTPNLESLYIESDSFAKYTIMNLGLLCIVSLDFCGFVIEKIEAKHVSRLAPLIKSIASTKYLLLYPGTTGVLAHSKAFSLGWCDDWPTFPNLTKLDVWMYELFGWILLPGILKSSPCLERLRLMKDLSDDHGYRTHADFSWIAPDCVPNCLLKELVVVKFESFTGNNNDLEVVEYLLENARALKSMVVGVQCRDFNHFVKKLMSLSRSSSLCKFEVYEEKEVDDHLYSSRLSASKRLSLQ